MDMDYGYRSFELKVEAVGVRVEDGSHGNCEGEKGLKMVKTCFFFFK